MRQKVRKVWKHHILATGFILAVLAMASSLFTLNVFSVFDPLEDTFTDLEVTDLVFSRFRDEPKPDTNIVVVNIGLLSRAEIARQLEVIRPHQPAAVGLDVLFLNRKQDTLADLYLAEQIRLTPNLVMVSRLEVGEDSEVTGISHSHEIFSETVRSGYANLNTMASGQDEFKTCRKFPAFRQMGDSIRYPFALELASQFDPDAARRFLERQQPYEIINYRGNIADTQQNTHYPVGFYAIDALDVLNGNFDPGLIRDKIVLFGYLGSSLQDTSWDDRFYTPLNIKYAGRTNPDMYGVVVHANILSMILSGEYINEFSDSSSPVGWMLTIIFTALIVILFTRIYRNHSHNYDLISKSIQAAGVILLLYLSIIALNYLDLKLEITLIITILIISGDLVEIYFNLYFLFRSRLRRNFLRVVRWHRRQLKRFKKRKYITDNSPA